ncbi:hypothetical protein [Nocardioides rubriscoriae]|uniref:hypothetical protein n=1 Tax=Nocardioides rubriscoriae TaxID=642762 RepID=UPI0011DF1D24|nr:hypothetical protein [Nocardioides rubriscoriae]
MAVLVGVVALTACSADPSPGEVGAGPPFAQGVAVAQASPGLDASVRSAGFDAATAYVAATTLSSLEVADAHTFVVTHAFPNGATADLTYRLSAGSGKVQPDDGVTLTAQQDGDRYLLSMAYAIDAATLPEDIRARVTDTDGATAAPLEGEGDSEVVVQPVAYAAGGSPSTVDVVVSGVVSQAQESYIDTWADRADSKVATGSWEAWKAGNKVWDAVNANDMIAQALAKLDALSTCAENPTNPLTRSQYANDPSAKKKVTDQLTDLKQEIKENAAALFLQLLVDTGSSLAGSAKWLGFIVSPATAYVKETLSSSITERVREAEALVPKCNKQSYAISGSIPSVPSGISVRGTACSLEKRFNVQTTGDLVGSFSFRPNRETGGTYAFKGTVGNAPISATGSGAYTITLSGDASTATLDFTFNSTIQIPNIGPRSGSAEAQLDLVAIAPCSD